ncbi:MAG: type IV pilus biogenesis/stability protein PilW [Gammaproteobacteria bacterium]|nr:type IV pilus biogenesis/stability protein PilW [Gammaproteobacteria bacterium]
MKPLSSLCLLLAVLLAAGCNTTPVRESDRATANVVGNYVELGIAYMKQGQYDVALNRLQRALDIDGSSPDAHNAMALLRQQLEQPALAEEHFQKAIGYDADFAAAHNNYGQFLCRRGRFEEGEREFILAAENPLNKNRDTAYTNAGLCMRLQQDLDKTERYFREALRLNPKQPVALLAMAHLSFDEGRYLPARAYLQRYAEVGSPTPESLWLGYRVETELGAQDAASSYALALRGRFPDAEETRLLDEVQSR